MENYDYFIYEDSLANADIAIGIIYGWNFQPLFISAQDNFVQLKLVGKSLSNEEKSLLRFYGNLI